MTKKKVAICFLGNLYFDTRTYNLYHSLISKKHEVQFIGFDWLTPDFTTIKEENVFIDKLVKRKFSLIFYLQFAWRSFWRLVKSRSHYLWAADFFCLPVCYLAALVTRSKVFYDSREVYTEITGFNNKPLIKKIVRFVEGFIIKRIHCTVTTGPLDSEYIENLYGLDKTYLLRNLPLPVSSVEPVDLKSLFPEKLSGPVLLYQGTIVKGRGIEVCFEIIKNYPDAGLVLLGGGEYLEYYQKMAHEMTIENRVVFVGKISQNELIQYTAGADVGLCLIDNISGNNYYALPNKLFECLMAGIPVLITDLPQMRDIVETWRVGGIVPENDIDLSIQVIKNWMENPDHYSTLKENTKKASRVLNWENEFEKIYPFFGDPKN